jgi:hypothetical protein
MTAQGHPRSIFNRAVERGNFVVAEATARELGRLTLEEALGLLFLCGRRSRSSSSAWLELMFPLLQESEALVPRDSTTSILHIQNRHDPLIHGAEPKRLRSKGKRLACASVLSP